MRRLIPTFDITTDLRIWSLGVLLGLPDHGSRFGIAVMVGPFIVSLEW